MITVGIISEYNPFHNGHLYQIETIRSRFGPDCAVIAIMSGNFVQRGEAALLDKWSRTRAALMNGVNLVIELPVVYATGSAERFADGGVALAAACGLCDYLVFGSEAGDLNLLDSIAETLAFEPPLYQQNLKSYLDLGFSFPVSRAKALHELNPELQSDILLGTSNNILAIEYLKAIKRRGIKSMRPLTIKREGQGYCETFNDDDAEAKTPFWSATAIRAKLLSLKPSGDFISSSDASYLTQPITTATLLQTIVNTMPTASLAILADKFHKKECIPSQEIFADSIFTQLRSSSIDNIALIPGMNEGLCSRFKDFAQKSVDIVTPLSTLIDNVATKRHPKTRVRRALLHMLLGLVTDDLELFDNQKGPFYLRILGFDKKGQYILKLMKKTATLPILMKGSDFLEYANNQENRALRRMAELDCIATDLWMFKIRKPSGQDFTTPPVTLLKPHKKSSC